MKCLISPTNVNKNKKIIK